MLLVEWKAWILLGESPSENDDARVLKRSMWVPEDLDCPKVWFVAPSDNIPPPPEAQKGPFRVSELLVELDTGRLTKEWYAAPSIHDESDDPTFAVHVDTAAGALSKITFNYVCRCSFSARQCTVLPK